MQRIFYSGSGLVEVLLRGKGVPDHCGSEFQQQKTTVSLQFAVSSGHPMDSNTLEVDTQEVDVPVGLTQSDQSSVSDQTVSHQIPNDLKPGCLMLYLTNGSRIRMTVQDYRKWDWSTLTFRPQQSDAANLSQHQTFRVSIKQQAS